MVDRHHIEPYGFGMGCHLKSYVGQGRVTPPRRCSGTAMSIMCSFALRSSSSSAAGVIRASSSMIVLRIRNAHKRICALICLSVAVVITYRYLGIPRGGQRISRKVGLSANSSQFTLEGEPFRILGGSIHYFRVPRAYWRDRLMKMKACGINTLTTYVPWSLHQPQRGLFNFHTQLDLEAYIHLAAELGLWVILRPGPYISSELDLGGLPSWLLQDDDMRVRTTYPGFTEAVNIFFDKLIPKVVPLQFKKGGPIIAVQVENEYGSFAKDDAYMPFIKAALQSRGIRELLLTSDNRNTLKSGGVDGAMRSLKLQKLNQRDIQDLTIIQPNGPIMVMDYWTGWYDVWGDLHHVLPPEDYDAPLSEAGEYTQKYHLLRDLFSQFNRGQGFPDMPVLQHKEAYEPAIMYQHLSLWDALSFTEGPFKSDMPVNMEKLPMNNRNGQSHGYTLYETTITSGGFLTSGDNVKDRALVFVNKSYIGLFKRQNLELAVPHGKGPRTLSLLVENCGRVHRGRDLDKQRKGLVGDILLNNNPLREFTIYSLEMKPSFIYNLYQAPWKTLSEPLSFPSFFMGHLFVYGYPSDTFVKLPGWDKGVVFINGINLGRYWSIGPQQTLYLPGPFLNRGINQIIVFEEQEGDNKVNFEDTADLGMAADIQ
ncbi:beta-galactosidase-1-like protein 2 isoform X2 [Phyllopteryx taeniolatus]|uniref:beta-galactosidase-1-like protein 2 isoform X2 n=1 Tax=Phyllopteryx taeniolatus TaxID=161469 RepID=UPI002AD4D6C6|nr:beta-galactosidase-1-like protein 2 isoform X2 [Phyllopteryx taeniolatus]